MTDNYGHFDEENREYVITRPDTPAPWINYLMGRDLHAIVSQNAGGLAFFGEPAEGRLTRYRFNGLPVDSPGLYLYIQDGAEIWNPSFRPTGTALDRFECRHGLGYTTFHAEKRQIQADVTYLIPPEDNVLLWSVRLRNNSDSLRRLNLTSYLEFSLHGFLKDTLAYLVCGNQWRLWFDKKVNGIRTKYFAFESLFEGECIFAPTDEVCAFDIDRDEFIGWGRTEANPLALEEGFGQSEIPDGGRQACGALQSTIELPPGETHHTLYRYAVSDDFVESERMLARYRTEGDVQGALGEIREFWESALGCAQVSTPDQAANRMLNTWLPYNTRVTFRHGRSISTRHTGAGGALRYRDSMQDAMPAIQLYPEEARRRIERILRTVYRDGHCATSVNPESLELSSDPDHIRGDAAVWGVFTVYRYVAETGDVSFLRKDLPYFDAGSGTVFDHLFQSLKFIAEHTGKDGLPELFDADWNDFLQIFTVAYEGCQSVMVAQQFVYAARLLTELARMLNGRESEINFLRNAAERFTKVLESDACWDGAWYRRVLGDGLVMGSRDSQDAKIFLNTQSWSVIAGTLDRTRVTKAMDAACRELNTECGLRIFAPAFRVMPDGKTRVPTNTPGAGENGGIFVHANTWAVMAEAMLGRGDRAWEYFSRILPPKLSARDPRRYANEPYAFTSWIYGPDHERYGTGQLSWLTGGAAWMYLVGLEYILGVRPTLNGLLIDPCIPSTWEKYSLVRRWRGTNYHITVENPHGICTGDVQLSIDGAPVEGNVLPETDKEKIDVTAVMRGR